MKQHLSIMGCGWLGLDLAKTLIELGYSVKGSTTTTQKLETLKGLGIDPHLIKLQPHATEGNVEGFLSESGILIIAVAPGLRKHPKKDHVKELEVFCQSLVNSSISKVLYISSTSVFKNDLNIPTIKANTLPNNTTVNARQLIAIEQNLNSLPNISTTILRFGGLIGSNRHPGYRLQGRQQLSDPLAPINLIHKTDCIAIISEVIRQHCWGETFNAVFPFHPNRKSYYTRFSEQHGLPHPSFNELEPSKGKIVESSALARALSYRFHVKP